MSKDLKEAVRILFVCHGNICRSPMAEFMLKSRVMKAGRDLLLGEDAETAKAEGRGSEDGGFVIDSAATSREEIGNDIYPPAKEMLSRKGIVFEERGARQMTADDYDRYDFLIGMDDANVRNMQRICGGDPENKISKILDFAGIDNSVADPWYTGDFEATYFDIEKGLNALEPVIGL